MSSFYLLTAFGKDRPGIVAQVTHAIFQASGNIEDASMTRLGGEFAMMVVIGLPNSRSGRLFQNALPLFQKKTGLAMNVKPIAAAQAHSVHRSHATHLISVYGTDHPGIVYRVAQAVADHRINITDLNTKTLQRAGKPLYVMMLEVQIGSTAKATAFKKILDRLGRTLRLEVVLHDIDPVAL